MKPLRDFVSSLVGKGKSTQIFFEKGLSLELPISMGRGFSIKRGMNMTNALKDVYNEEFIIHLAKTVQQFYDRFDGDAFINLVFSDNWTEKTLKGRMRHVTTCLNAFLPHEYEDAIHILQKVAPNLSNHTLASIVFPDFVEVYGLENWDVSLPALEWFTQYSTSEYADSSLHSTSTGYNDRANDEMELSSKPSCKKVS